MNSTSAAELSDGLRAISINGPLSRLSALDIAAQPNAEFYAGKSGDRIHIYLNS
jgi:hypothetical protein